MLLEGQAAFNATAGNDEINRQVAGQSSSHGEDSMTGSHEEDPMVLSSNSDSDYDENFDDELTGDMNM